LIFAPFHGIKSALFLYGLSILKISRLADYAVVTMSGLTHTGPHRAASELAEAVRLPEPTVSKVLKILTREGLLESVRGTNGGYRLARAPRDITVLDVVTAVEGPITLTPCTDGSHESCQLSGRCSVSGRWNPVNQAIRTALENVTLADMSAPKGPPKTKLQVTGAGAVFRPVIKA
jgi:FeS assembly SUF system regulator